MANLTERDTCILVKEAALMPRQEVSYSIHEMLNTNTCKCK